MPYVESYDEIFDECFQIEVDEQLAAKIKLNPKMVVTDTANPKLPILSRYRSVRHPEFYNDKWAVVSD